LHDVRSLEEIKEAFKKQGAKKLKWEVG
jgi:hypothetical protein